MVFISFLSLFQIRKSEGPFGTGYLALPLSLFLGEEEEEEEKGVCTRALENERERKGGGNGRAFNGGLKCFFTDFTEGSICLYALYFLNNCISHSYANVM